MEWKATSKRIELNQKQRKKWKILEEEGQTSLKAVRLDIEKLFRLHSLTMSEFAWNRVVSRQLPFGVIGVFFFFPRKKLD